MKMPSMGSGRRAGESNTWQASSSRVAAVEEKRGDARSSADSPSFTRRQADREESKHTREQSSSSAPAPSPLSADGNGSSESRTVSSGDSARPAVDGRSHVHGGAAVAPVAAGGDDGGRDAGDAQPVSVPEVVSQDALNKLAKKLMKAELAGNAEAVAKLQAKLLKAREGNALAEARAKQQAQSTTSAVRRPPPMSASSSATLTAGQRQQEQPSKDTKGPLEVHVINPNLYKPTHAHEQPRERATTKLSEYNEHGERVRFYRDDDDGRDIGDLAYAEKHSKDFAYDGKMADQIMRNHRYKNIDSFDDDFGPVGLEEAGKKHRPRRGQREQTQEQVALARAKQQAIADAKFVPPLQRHPKHLIVAIGEQCFLALPPRGTLAAGHCWIVPMSPTVSLTSASEDLLNEVSEFKKALVAMLKADDEDCVFMETVTDTGRKGIPNTNRNTYLECVPLSAELGSMSPMYFKNALEQADEMWSQHKKIIDTSRGRGIVNSVPAGFPYFHVEFGLDGGYAHVIEDANKFPSYFGRSVVGGMLDMPPRTWLHPRNEQFPEQKRAVLAFCERFKAYDWTARLAAPSGGAGGSSQ